MWSVDDWKRPWCWEGPGTGGEGDDRRWNGWMASLTQWTWVWGNSGRWWWIGSPEVLWFMGSQRVGHDWVTELNWTETPRKNVSKTTREKQQVSYKGNPICLTALLSAETLQAWGDWQNIFKLPKGGENLPPRLLYTACMSFKTDGDIKSCSDKQELRQVNTTKAALQQMLKGVI